MKKIHNKRNFSPRKTQLWDSKNKGQYIKSVHGELKSNLKQLGINK